jgi:hypothetical protein
MRGVRKFSDGTVKNETYLASLARSYTDAAISTLFGIMTSASSHDSMRIRAAEILLDRGWGKAVERYAVERSEAALEIPDEHDFQRTAGKGTATRAYPPRSIFCTAVAV